MPKNNITTPARFWKRIQETPTGCWLWTGQRSWDGRYGSVGFNARKQMAHRVAWQLKYGSIPTGMNVLHHCDITLCVRPEHLFLGSHADNMRDMHMKGRAHPPTGNNHRFRLYPELIPRGDNHASSKLTSHEVLEIRQRYAGGETQSALARLFDMSQAQVWAIVRRHAWKHL